MVYKNLSLGIAFSTCLFSIQVSANGKNSANPNNVFFLVDDMGWQETSVPFWKEKTMLNERYHTPNMKILAARGVKFTQKYVCPLSSPTRLSLTTGINSVRH
ncbi:MAG TPA: sulfatase-like hydrolase/transferase [Prolixibacteraceae bacterium]|nr:sulfatase-like hydrolase/transferase [Prolixibacteraceae bacterium]